MENMNAKIGKEEDDEIVAKFRQRTRIKKTKPKLRYNRLLNDLNCKEMYTNSVKNRYNELKQNRILKWLTLRFSNISKQENPNGHDEKETANNACVSCRISDITQGRQQQVQAGEKKRMTQ